MKEPQLENAKSTKGIPRRSQWLGESCCHSFFFRIDPHISPKSIGEYVFAPWIFSFTQTLWKYSKLTFSLIYFAGGLKLQARVGGMSGQQRDVLKWQLIVNKCFLWILLLDLCQVRRPQQATLQTVATDGFLPASHFGDACRDEHVTWPMPSSNGPNGSWFGFGELTSKSVQHKLYKEVGFKLSNKLTLQEYLVKVWPLSYRISNPLTHVRSRRWSWSHEVVVRCQTPHNVLWQADGSLKVGERMKGSLKVGWAFVAFQGQEICTSKNIYNIFCINDKGSSGLGKKMVSRVSFC